MPSSLPRPALELADILRAHGAAYAERHPLSAAQARALAALVACRTAALAVPPSEPVVKETVAAFVWRVLRIDIHRCPVCGEGRLRCYTPLPRQRAPPGHA